MSTEHKGQTHTRPLSCGFDSSVGRALHRLRKGCAFESHSKPENVSGHFSSSVMAASTSIIMYTLFLKLLLLDIYYLTFSFLSPNVFFL